MGEYDLANYNSIKDIKESEFYKTINNQDKHNKIKNFFSKIKKINNLNELINFVMLDEGKIPSEFNSKNYEKLEKYVQQILINEGLNEYQKILSGEVNLEEEVEKKSMFAYILDENVLDEQELSEITYKHKFYRYNKENFIEEYLIPNLTDRVCEFLEEPGSFTLNEEGIPKEFYEKDYF